MNLGRDSDHLCQPMTTCFQVGGVEDRLMPTCMVMGQAAGTALAIANAENLQLDQVPVAKF